MALGATVYKATIGLSNIDANYYDSLSLIIAQHPSETVERLTARLLVYCFNARDAESTLSFTRGLSTTDEPDLWEKDLTEQILHWIEVGQPDADRIKYAGKRADKVSVYTFAKSSDTWWKLQGEKLSQQACDVWQFPWEEIQTLSLLIERNINADITITENNFYISINDSSVSIPINRLATAET